MAQMKGNTPPPVMERWLTYIQNGDLSTFPLVSPEVPRRWNSLLGGGATGQFKKQQMVQGEEKEPHGAWQPLGGAPERPLTVKTL